MALKTAYGDNSNEGARSEAVIFLLILLTDSDGLDKRG